MRLGQIYHQWPLPCDTEQMDSDNIVADPSRGRVLPRLAFVVRKCGPMVPERGANAVLQGRLHQHTHRHDHEECHDALRLFARQRRGQKLGVFQKTEPTFRLTLAFVAVEEFLRGHWLVVKCIGGQDTTTLPGDPRLSSRQGGSQSTFHLVDHLCRWGTEAWAPPFARPRDGTDRDLGAWCHLQALLTGTQGL